MLQRNNLVMVGDPEITHWLVTQVRYWHNNYFQNLLVAIVFPIIPPMHDNQNIR